MNPNTSRLCGNGSPYPMHQVDVPCCRQTDTLRKHALFEAANAMQTLRNVHEWYLEARFLHVQGREGVHVRLVERVPVVDDAYYSSWSELKGMVVKLVVTLGADGVVGEEQVELECHFWDRHLVDDGFDEGGFIGVRG